MKAQFRALLRSVADELPEVQVTVDQLGENAIDLRPLPLNRYILNRYKIGMNAVRFTAPGNDDSYNFWWMFLYKQAEGVTWYILPAEDSIDGFTHFEFKRNIHSGIRGAPTNNFLCYQTLNGGQIKSGREYIIWFVSNPKEPFDVYLNIDLKRLPKPNGP